jgi:hypothetical protein
MRKGLEGVELLAKLIEHNEVGGNMKNLPARIYPWEIAVLYSP